MCSLQFQTSQLSKLESVNFATSELQKQTVKPKGKGNTLAKLVSGKRGARISIFPRRKTNSFPREHQRKISV